MKQPKARCFVGYLAIIFFFLFTNKLFAQSTTNTDFLSWNGITIKYKPIKNLSLSLDNQIRFNENVTSFDSYFTEIGGDFEINEYLDYGASYRYTVKNKHSQNKQRISNQITYYPNLLKTDLSFGFRVKHQYNFVWNRQKSNHDLRLKASFEYDNKKWIVEPEFGFELFYDLSHPTEKLSRIRGDIEISYPFKGKGAFEPKKISLAYLFQHSMNEKVSLAEHIIALKAAFEIKTRK